MKLHLTFLYNYGFETTELVKILWPLTRNTFSISAGKERISEGIQLFPSAETVLSKIIVHGQRIRVFLYGVSSSPLRFVFETGKKTIGKILDLLNAKQILGC